MHLKYIFLPKNGFKYNSFKNIYRIILKYTAYFK